MSRELNELKSNLRVAAASVTNDEIAARESSCSEPTFSSSEVAVQAILECLKNNEFLTAVRYIRECRWEKKKVYISVHEKGTQEMSPVKQITFYLFITELLGRATSLAAPLRMRSRPYSTSISDIRPWVRRELLLSWAQNRTWQKSLSSWWNLTGRFGTWSGEPKATEPSRLSSQTPGSQAQLFDGGPAACDISSRTAPCSMPRLRSCLGLLLSSQRLTSTPCSLLGITKPSTSLCSENVRMSELQMCSNTVVFLETWETLPSQGNLGFYCTNNRKLSRSNHLLLRSTTFTETNDIPKLSDSPSVVLF